MKNALESTGKQAGKMEEGMSKLEDRNLEMTRCKREEMKSFKK